MKSNQNHLVRIKLSLFSQYFVLNVYLVPFWYSIRVAVAFLGLLGMASHFSQKSNISIGLVCMVNHSAIERYHINSTKTQTVLPNDDCPLTNNTNHIVNKSNKPFIHFCFF